MSSTKFQLIVHWKRGHNWGVDAEIICATRDEARELAAHFIGDDRPDRTATIFEGWLVRLGQAWVFETNPDVDVEVIDND